MAITEILPDDSVSASLPVINGNFSYLEDSINSITETFNPLTKEGTFSTVTVERGANSTSVVIVENQASESIAGNLSVAGTITVSSETVNNGLTVAGGNISHNNATGKISTLGSLEVYGSTIYKGASDSYIDAASSSSYESGNVSGTNAILSVSNKNHIMLDFSQYNGTTKNIISVQLPSGTAGQEITIVTQIGASVGNHHLKYNGIAGMGSSEVISFTSGTRDYRNVTLIWTGSAWIIKNLFNAEIV